MNLIKTTAVILMCGMAISASAQKKVKLKSDVDTLSYSLGVSFASNIKQNVDKTFGDVSIDYDLILSAIEHSFSGEEIMQAKQASNYVNNYFMRRQNKEAEQNLKEAKAFLAENKEKEGVKTTSSGLQYKVIREGDGPKPQPQDKVTVHYEGTLIDGKKFDSSYDRGKPATFQLNKVITGWTEGLQLMPEGSIFMFYIPPELGYGKNPRPGGVIKPNDALIFKVELIKVEDSAGASQEGNP